jgi:transcriptional regulator with XRE-family HTH domain
MLALRSTAGVKDRKPLTQSVVAAHLEISQSYLSKVENGHQEPGFLLVEKMCAYYGLETTEMWTLSEDERRQCKELQFER